MLATEFDAVCPQSVFKDLFSNVKTVIFNILTIVSLFYIVFNFPCSIFNYLLCSLSHTGSITPTVELNGLAMKRGEPAIYRPLDPKPMPNYRANYNFRGMFNQR